MRVKPIVHPYDRDSCSCPVRYIPATIGYGRGDGPGGRGQWGDGWGAGGYELRRGGQYGGAVDHFGYPIHRDTRLRGKGASVTPKQTKEDQ